MIFLLEVFVVETVVSNPWWVRGYPRQERSPLPEWGRGLLWRP
jgi:hypothetical protein